MTLRRMILPLFTLLVTSLAVQAQNSKQELNDQFFEAVRKGDAAAVTALLDRGAEVNAKFRYGATALFKAAERGHTEVVKILLARGADVAVKDTFYQATAMTWALNHKHVEVIRLLLEKDASNVGEVLMTGAREGNPQLVKAALDRGGVKAETLTSALVIATTGDAKNAEAADLLKKAGAVPPLEVDAETLQSYVGKYKAETPPIEMNVTLKEGRLSAVVGTQQPISLMPLNKTTFKPTAFDGITITFNVEAGKATGFALQQGPSTTQLKRVDEPKQP